MEKHAQNKNSISFPQAHSQSKNRSHQRWLLRLIPAGALLVIIGGLLMIIMQQFQQNTHFISEEEQRLAKQFQQEYLAQEAKIKKISQQLSAGIESPGEVKQLQETFTKERKKLRAIMEEYALQQIRSRYPEEKYVIYDAEDGIPAYLAMEGQKIKPEFHGTGGAMTVNGRVYPLPLEEMVLIRSNSAPDNSEGFMPSYNGIKIEKIAEGEDKVAQKHEPALPATDQLQTSVQQDNNIESTVEDTVSTDFEDFWAEFLAQEAESETQSLEDTRYPDLSIEPGSDPAEFMQQQSGTDKSTYTATQNFFESLLANDDVAVEEDIIDLLRQASEEVAPTTLEKNATHQMHRQRDIKARPDLPPEVQRQLKRQRRLPTDEFEERD